MKIAFTILQYVQQNTDRVCSYVQSARPYLSYVAVKLVRVRPESKIIHSLHFSMLSVHTTHNMNHNLVKVRLPSLEFQSQSSQRSIRMFNPKTAHTNWVNIKSHPRVKFAECNQALLDINSNQLRECAHSICIERANT